MKSGDPSENVSVPKGPETVSRALGVLVVVGVDGQLVGRPRTFHVTGILQQESEIDR